MRYSKINILYSILLACYILTKTKNKIRFRRAELRTQTIQLKLNQNFNNSI